MARRNDGLPSIQSVALDALREAGEPLWLDEIVERVARKRPLALANPRKTLKQALGQIELVEVTEDDRYAYVPDILAGASFRLPLAASNIKTGRLRVGPEVVAALWPGNHYSPDPARPAIALPDGRTMVPTLSAVTTFTYELALPGEFGEWVGKLRRDGFAGLVLRCQDGNAGRFTLEGVESVQPGPVALRNARVLETARRLFLHTKTIWPSSLALRLLARGAYHGEPQPDPLAKLLFEVDGRFCLSGGPDIVFRPSLTPGLRRFFRDRLASESAEVDLAQNALANPRQLRFGFRHSAPQRDKARPTATQPLCYRFKVRLQWNRSVWRTIDILEHQTLDDLHWAIQRVFDWESDHLYSFFLSGQAWDRLTAIAGPFGDSEPPTADEVEIRDLELQPNQKFLYLYDFGDDIRHEVELIEVLAVPAGGTFPRIVDQHGKAPSQYPEWDDDEEE